MVAVGRSNPTGGNFLVNLFFGTFCLADIYRPHTEYDGKVMFSVCLFTGGGPPGVPLYQLGGGAPGGTPLNFGQKCWTKNGQSFGQKMDKILDKKLDKHFGNFWRRGARAVRLLRSRRRTVLSVRFSVRLAYREKPD